MIRFNNDYNHGAHASILQALAQTNDTQYGGYGVDDWCDKAEKLILELSRCPQGKVYFFPGATQANFVTISALLGSCDSVICADTGHINCHGASRPSRAKKRTTPTPSSITLSSQPSTTTSSKPATSSSSRPVSPSPKPVPPI